MKFFLNKLDWTADNFRPWLRLRKWYPVVLSEGSSGCSTWPGRLKISENKVVSDDSNDSNSERKDNYGFSIGWLKSAQAEELRMLGRGKIWVTFGSDPDIWINPDRGCIYYIFVDGWPLAPKNKSVISAFRRSLLEAMLLMLETKIRYLFISLCYSISELIPLLNVLCSLLVSSVSCPFGCLPLHIRVKFICGEGKERKTLKETTHSFG